MERKPIKLKNEIRDMTIEEVYEQFKLSIYKQCQSWLGKYEFDDLQQVAFIGLQKAYESYEIKDEAIFLTYATTVIVNELRRYNKKNEKHLNNSSLNKKIQIKDGEIEHLEVIPDNVDYENEAITNMQYEKLHLAIEKLHLLEKEIVNSIIFKYEPQVSIARRLNLSSGTISKYYKQALNDIRDIMKGDVDMAETKVTRQELLEWISEHGSGKESLTIMARKKKMTLASVRSYLDAWDIRKYSKDYRGNKLIEPREVTQVKKSENTKSILTPITIYKGSVGVYEIKDTCIDLKLDSGVVSIEKSNINSLIDELQELRKVI